MPGEVRERVHAACENGVSQRRLHAESAWAAGPLNVPPNGKYGAMSEVSAPRQGSMETEMVAFKDTREDGDVVMVQRSSSVNATKGWRTKHSLHFRGSKWSSVLKKHRAALEAAVVEDIVDASGLDMKRIENITFAVLDTLVVTFMVRPQDHLDTIGGVHVALQTYNFPRTSALYREHRFLSK
ncbi:putative mitotubule-associated protein Gb4 [Trypanosoma rangeli]|uniref:Putative mitotubule-associated protein Gb4 n=1 Tax=Trypanosoma rangeli TaxID=5698 RepID=A0A422N0F4_TRYRA|nr:putative mitotubule-associated protein Gb4 [Trypanosoma rangeli]RNE98941.1 putative mitotubule-associated protein Gb4 [Trypanosoma rangeli]|eukprot:RNE98941.1 putative mitotubule-associated protein Gb4 [Trypanosoma rangeli]